MQALRPHPNTPISLPSERVTSLCNAREGIRSVSPVADGVVGLV
jgi:hypothetical protein